MAPAQNRSSTAWRARWLAGAGFVALVAGGASAGCATASVPVAPAASAQVTIANLTDHAWRIVLHPLPAGGPGNVQILSVAARATESFRLVPGDYAIEQGIAGAAEDSWGRRRFTANFAARERYEWSLATARAFGAGEAAARTEGSP